VTYCWINKGNNVSSVKLMGPKGALLRNYQTGEH